jgi:MarR family 2-MHQ and catechol resistance regulon transcriptional repressor
MSLRLIPPIHRATHRIGLYLARIAEDGLTQGAAHILARLAPTRRATIAELHADLAHQRSTLTSILDRLVERGLVTRQVGTDDRRTFVVTLTAKGRTVARRVYRHLAALERTAIARVTADDLGGFAKVIAAVEDEARKRSPRR